MVKHFCDRCGKEIISTASSIPLTDVVLSRTDICDDCHTELQDWFVHPRRYQELYKKLHDPENHKKLGEAIAEGLRKARGIKNEQTTSEEEKKEE